MRDNDNNDKHFLKILLTTLRFSIKQDKLCLKKDQ